MAGYVLENLVSWTMVYEKLVNLIFYAGNH